ncbi:hypothetical protein [Candidatus Poriferisodalis sp.]|uniref:hypothetical protein n=1 Tax=Candidatus Poriferisodalis sp. TaxID=3101277 RepID=UPI003D1528BE
MFRKLTASAVVVVIIMAAACSGDDGRAGDGTQTSAATAETATPVAAAPGMSRADVEAIVESAIEALAEPRPALTVADAEPTARGDVTASPLKFAPAKSVSGLGGCGVASGCGGR